MNDIKYYPHTSVDCVVFGFDGEKLKVLLLERSIKEENALINDKKLPGSIILENEDLDDAANRILFELTGMKNIYLSQFHSFGKPNRISASRDILWLENTTKLKIGRVVTVGYVALIKIGRKIQFKSEKTEINWHDINILKNSRLAFDHNEIIQKGLEHTRRNLDLEPQLFFELLPRKFTLSQFRILHDTVHQTKSDVRNFQKKVAKMPYIVALDEKEKNVSHRAARYFMFDRKKI